MIAQKVADSDALLRPKVQFVASYDQQTKQAGQLNLTRG